MRSFPFKPQIILFEESWRIRSCERANFLLHSDDIPERDGSRGVYTPVPDKYQVYRSGRYSRPVSTG